MPFEVLERYQSDRILIAVYRSSNPVRPGELISLCWKKPGGESRGRIMGDVEAAKAAYLEMVASDEAKNPPKPSGVKVKITRKRKV